MAFHFPLMPRIFMAVRRESRFPISEILAQTPAIPDELPVGHLPAQPRRADPGDGHRRGARLHVRGVRQGPADAANVGIRRRLAPLLDNDRNQIELFTALLLSLPGSPVLYYGDEIGMGDNIWLGDRDGVRTPMQWTPDRNAGFSPADPGRLYLPVDPGPGVRLPGGQRRGAAATARPRCCNWTRTMLAVRKRHQAFALGTFRELGGSNPSVLAFLRESRRRRRAVRQQPVPASRSRSSSTCSSGPATRPIELTGDVHFPSIGQLPYLLTLPGHGFYWFQLCGPPAEQS